MRTKVIESIIECMLDQSPYSVSDELYYELYLLKKLNNGVMCSDELSRAKLFWKKSRKKKSV